MIGDLTTTDILVNEQRGDYFPPSEDKLALQKDSFLVCQRSCSMENIRFLSFSQKRFTGFRNFYEFEQKRVLLANETKIQILAYHPTDIARGVRLTRGQLLDGVGNGQNYNSQCLPDPTEQSTGMLLCCGGTYSNNRQDLLESQNINSRRQQNNRQKESLQNSAPIDASSELGASGNLPLQMINNEDLVVETGSHNTGGVQNVRSQRLKQFQEMRRSTLGEADTVPCQKFEVVTQYHMPENEKIIYAGFLYDQNPTFVLVITVNEVENCSYLSLGKINNSATSEHNIEDSEQELKKNLAKKLEVNPNTQKILQRNEGQMNMTLNLTPQTLKMLSET